VIATFFRDFEEFDGYGFIKLFFLLLISKFYMYYGTTCTIFIINTYMHTYIHTYLVQHPTFPHICDPRFVFCSDSP